MSATAVHLFAGLTIGAGASLLVTGFLLRVQKRQKSLAELLDLEGGEGDVPVEVVTESPEGASMSRFTVRMGEMLGRLDSRGSLTKALNRADIPMKAGEYLFLAGLAAVMTGVLVGWIAGSAIAAILAVILVAVAARFFLRFRSNGRKNKLRSQLPDAFSLIASSVSSGHTFLRSIQILSDQIPEPLAVELQQVTAEVTLGSNLIDALENFAHRSDITELHWAVKAVRIQQSTGGQLSELLHTLADFMRAREEVFREVRVLTAEGRFSGYVLMALPLFITGFLLATNERYLRPMFHGLGLVALIVAALMMVVGHIVIRRMVNIEV